MSLDELRRQWQEQYKKGFAKPFLLLTLSESESYPYKLAKDIFERTNGEISIATSNIYPILKKMSKSELIEEKRVDKQLTEKMAGKRTTYSITAKGRDFLIEIQKDIQPFLSILQKNLGIKEQETNEE